MSEAEGRILREARSQSRIAIVIPTFEDWESLDVLLPALDAAIAARDFAVRVVVVDDCSQTPMPAELRKRTYRHLRRVEVLRLRRNLGHQRAIALGLVYVHQLADGCDTIVVMDGDGEDKPEDVPKLIDALAQRPEADVVFAQRARRQESWFFQAMYHLYRGLHWLLTGVAVRVGNFSALRPAALHRVVIVSELWNHYAASVFRSRIPFQTLPLARGERYRGRSKMRFSGLVMHGLSAISVFSDIVGVRLMVSTLVVMLVSGVLMVTVLGVRLFTDLAIPGWATSAIGLLAVVLGQALLVMLVLSFIILGNRSQVNVIPLTDTQAFVDGVEEVFRAA